MIQDLFSITFSAIEPPECGGSFNSDNGTINSPGWPNSYKNSMDCFWHITVDGNLVIRLTFMSFDIENNFDKLEIM